MRPGFSRGGSFVSCDHIEVVDGCIVVGSGLGRRDGSDRTTRKLRDHAVAVRNPILWPKELENQVTAQDASKLPVNADHRSELA